MGQPDHLSAGQMDAILFSYALVQYSNGLSSLLDMAHNTKTFEIPTSKSLVFKWPVSKSSLYIIKTHTVGIQIMD